ncbi:MAG: alkaline phosphatase family protein [Chitinophagales bacterium]|nr:alkaline phosphatase family protein [Chitinophagales bacterium]
MDNQFIIIALLMINTNSILKLGLLLFLSILLENSLFSQRIVGPPMVSHASSSSIRIWLAAKGEGAKHPVLVNTETGSLIQPSTFESLVGYKDVVSLTAEFNGLQADTEYDVTFSFTEKYDFTTRTDPEFSDSSTIKFLAGSCFFLPSGLWKLFIPSFNIMILRKMLDAQSDFMLWLGDNLYYIGADLSSFEEMFRKQIEQRRNSKHLRSLLKKQPNYSIWDDHDYGPNNSNRYFYLKDTSLLIHRSFWPNPYPEGKIGSYYSFSKGDADFFMLDDRYHRSSVKEKNKTLLGDEQLNWLKESLSRSVATFKFIAIGSQALNESIHSEFFASYKQQRKELFDFLVDENIEGIIFLSGDRHFSEITTRTYRGKKFYEVTSSPVLSVPRNLSGSSELNNQFRIDGSLITQRNFSRITLSGLADNRSCLVEFYNKRGKLLFTYSIPANR